MSIKTKNSYQCPKTVEFYDRFKLANHHFRLKPLLTVGIMLSSGAPRQKAKLLFESLDPSDQKELKNSDIEELVDYMLDIAINYLPILVSNETFPPISEAKVAVYVEKLANKRERAKKEIMKIFLGGHPKDKDTITLGEFQNVFNNEDHARLFFPYGLRSFIYRRLEMISKPKKSSPSSSDLEKVKKINN